MTSFTPNRALSSASSTPHAAPAAKPARNISATSSGPGRCTFRPIHVAAVAPASSCPSAPMFQNFARNTKASPAPMRMSGIALVTVSPSP